MAKKKFEPAQLDKLREDNSCIKWAGKYVALRRHGPGVYVGSCLNCSKNLKSKTATRCDYKDDGWVCAGCGKAGDVISLVRLGEGCSFVKAVEILGGVAEIDPAERERRDKERKAKADKDAEDHAKYREKERGKAYDIWKRGIAAEGSSADLYLQRRGVDGIPVDRGHLRCIEDMPYYLTGAKNAEVIHRGPALLAPIMRGGIFHGLHITYIDLEQPKGKAAIKHPETGDLLDARKVRGSKAGGFIEIAGCASPARLFLGEGIEKVGAVYLSMCEATRAAWDTTEATAFWTCVDLGNLGGKAAEGVKHPTLKTANNRARGVPGPVPNLDAPGIEIPASVTELIILADSTSDRFETLCAVARAVARFSRPGLVIRVAWPPEAEDFDDTRVRAGGAAVVAAIEAAAPFDPAEIEALKAGAPRDSAACAGQTNGAGVAGGRSAFSSSADTADLPDPPDAAGAAADAAEDDTNPPTMDDVMHDRDDDAPPPDLGAYGAADFAAAVALAAAPPRGAGERQPSQKGRSRKAADRGGWDGAPPGDIAALNRQLAYFPQTDLGNVERFVQRNKHRLRYCAALGWIAWDGKRWSREGAAGLARRAEHETVRAIQDEAEAIRETDDDYLFKTKNKGKEDEEEVMFSDLLAGWGRASEQASRLNPISVRAQPYITVEAHQLDADQFKITINNGTLWLRREGWGDEPLAEGWEAVNAHVRLAPHDQADYITKLMPVTFDPDAEAPVYEQFLRDVQPNGSVRAFLDVWNGYSLTGDASEQRLVFHYGTGKNGKSTEIAIRLHIAGDYGRSIPIDTFVDQGRARSAGQATPDLAMLRGARVVMTSEPEKGWRLNEGLIKALTGGDEVPVRELHKEYFYLKPEFKLTMAGNYKPRIDGGDAESGIWRRVVLVPWVVRIAKEKRDMHLGKKLIAEASGILNRWLAGFATWAREGLKLPDEVAQATEKFRSESDPLGRFIEECTKATPDGRVQAMVLYDLFVAWARANGEVGRQDWTATGFGRAMSERGYDKIKSGLLYYVNIVTTKSVNDFVDVDGNPLKPSNGAAGEAKGGKDIDPGEVEV